MAEVGSKGIPFTKIVVAQPVWPGSAPKPDTLKNPTPDWSYMSRTVRESVVTTGDIVPKLKVKEYPTRPLADPAVPVELRRMFDEDPL